MESIVGVNSQEDITRWQVDNQIAEVGESSMVNLVKIGGVKIVLAHRDISNQRHRKRLEIEALNACGIQNGVSPLDLGECFGPPV